MDLQVINDTIKCYNKSGISGKRRIYRIMVSKVIIRDISVSGLDKTDIKCAECSFWFDYDRGTFLEEISNIKSLFDLRHFFKNRLYNRCYDKRDQKKLVILYQIMEAL